MRNEKTHNKSLHWIFTPLRSVKTSEFKRYRQIDTVQMKDGKIPQVIFDSIKNLNLL